MNFIINFLIKHYSSKITASTIYNFFKSIPIEEFKIYVEEYLKSVDK